MAIIRTFHPSDLHDIMPLAERTLGEIYNPGIYTTVFQVSPEGFIVSYEGKDLVGFSVAVPEGRSLRILMLSVNERFQRMGVGHSLVQELVTRFLSKGITTLSLEVRISNDVAISFYRKLGFTIDSLIPDYYSSGESAYKMIRQIG